MMRGEERIDPFVSVVGTSTSSQFTIFQQGWISYATQAKEATGEREIERSFLC